MKPIGRTMPNPIVTMRMARSRSDGGGLLLVPDDVVRRRPTVQANCLLSRLEKCWCGAMSVSRMK
jgi:hypothetical protein